MSTARKAIVCMLMLLVLTMPALTEAFDSHPSPEVVTSKIPNLRVWVFLFTGEMPYAIIDLRRCGRHGLGFNGL